MSEQKKEKEMDKETKLAWDTIHAIQSGLDYWLQDMYSNGSEAKVNRQVMKFALKGIVEDLQRAKDLLRGITRKSYI